MNLSRAMPSFDWQFLDFFCYRVETPCIKLVLHGNFGRGWLAVFFERISPTISHTYVWSLHVPKVENDVNVVFISVRDEKLTTRLLLNRLVYSRALKSPKRSYYFPKRGTRNGGLFKADRRGYLIMSIWGNGDNWANYKWGSNQWHNQFKRQEIGGWRERGWQALSTCPFLSFSTNLKIKHIQRS